ncbi:hypothetical protein [Streptomyces sp. NBC_00467]|uniref:hypothetical protein n=1 Tax=Streptomyces sp. NBC_00467 TaxID=2975752 RepID=UPI002E1911EC
MWSQQPGDGQNPYAGQNNPYQQTGPHGPPQQAPWPGSPTMPAGAPQPPPRGGRRTSTVIAVAAALVVVVAAGVTGFVVLGGDEGKTADPGPTTSASGSPADDNPRDTDDPKPVVAGWKVVVNPKRGIAFDVPPQWGLKGPGWVNYVADDRDPEEKPLIGMSSPAMLKEKWCRSDAAMDGSPEDTALASAGTRGDSGAKTIEDAARSSVSLWLYGAYTQPDKKSIKAGAVEPYTTASGIAGSLATGVSTGAPKKGKCDTDGKVTTFAFKDPGGDFVSWTFVGAKGVADEVPDATVRKILGTVRLTS